MVDDAEAVVREFIGHFEHDWPADLDAPLELVADDGYYQVAVGLTEPIRGKAAIKRAWEQMIEMGVESQKHEMRAVASNGSVVFTERVDQALSGGAWSPIPLVAVFEVEGGLIRAWREYVGGDMSGATEALANLGH